MRGPRPVPTPLGHPLRAAVAASLLSLALAPARASDAPQGPSEADAARARAEFEAIRDLQARRQFLPARRKFQEWLEAWPQADAALREEAEDRSADNAILGIEQIHAGGPSDNRIDVELMGDGYLITQQDTFRKHATDQLKEFWREPLYDEYASYLNIWRFDLASKEEGVDEVARPEPPGGGPSSRPSKKRSRPLKEYSTALNCQAAGPQNQVWADPEMVFQWRKYLKVSDGLSICFAKKGSLGMGGMGIATTGRRVAVVHEFGHAFVGLLDEYTNQPGPPAGRIAARNAISGRGPKEPPELPQIPWRHWLDAKNPEVGVFLGGATYELGVWRPAATCAMNSGGSSAMCWVCREAGVLRLYEYVNPIDRASPQAAEVSAAHGESIEFSVVPLAPKRHRLLVDWFLQKLKSRSVTEGGGSALPVPPSGPGLSDPAGAPIALNPDGWSRGPERGLARHAAPWPPGPPRGEEVAAVERKADGGQFRSVVTLSGLPVGRYRLTARVRDDARVPGYEFPWVLRDPDKILEERRVWEVEIR